MMCIRATSARVLSVVIVCCALVVYCAGVLRACEVVGLRLRADLQTRDLTFTLIPPRAYWRQIGVQGSNCSADYYSAKGVLKRIAIEPHMS